MLKCFWIVQSKNMRITGTVSRDIVGEEEGGLRIMS